MDPSPPPPLPPDTPSPKKKIKALVAECEHSVPDEGDVGAVVLTGINRDRQKHRLTGSVNNFY